MNNQTNTSAIKPAIDLDKIGERLEFNDARERTNGQRSEGTMTLGAGKKGPPSHIHTRQLEGFEVISGQMVAVVNGKSIVANAGETIIVQAGEPHSFINGSQTEPLVAKFWYEPAGNTEWMLQTLGGMATERGGDWDNVPALPFLFTLFKMRREYRLAAVPGWLQDVLFGLGAAIAKLTGASKKVPLPPGME